MQCGKQHPLLLPIKKWEPEQTWLPVPDDNRQATIFSSWPVPGYHHQALLDCWYTEYTLIELSDHHGSVW